MTLNDESLLLTQREILERNTKNTLGRGNKNEKDDMAIRDEFQIFASLSLNGVCGPESTTRPVSEKGFIVDAAKEAGAASLSAFIRDTVLDRSRTILGRDLAPRTEPFAGVAPAPLLHAYIGARPLAGDAFPDRAQLCHQPV